jgi:glucose/mannose transport system permease protein
MTQVAQSGERASGLAGVARSRPRLRRRFNFQSVLGTTPMIMTAVGVFVICIIFSIIWSFTNSKLFPNFNFVGFDQYQRLWRTDRWIISVQNVFVFGVLSIGCGMIFGYLLAVFMDQRIKQEDLFRSIFLYPFAMSLVVTGLVWQWMFDPNLGIQAAVREMGWTDFEFAPLASRRPRSTASCSPASGTASASPWPSCLPACAASTRKSGRRPRSTAFRPGDLSVHRACR